MIKDVLSTHLEKQSMLGGQLKPDDFDQIENEITNRLMNQN